MNAAPLPCSIVCMSTAEMSHGRDGAYGIAITPRNIHRRLGPCLCAGPQESSVHFCNDLCASARYRLSSAMSLAARVVRVSKCRATGRDSGACIPPVVDVVLLAWCFRHCQPLRECTDAIIWHCVRLLVHHARGSWCTEENSNRCEDSVCVKQSPRRISVGQIGSVGRLIVALRNSRAATVLEAVLTCCCAAAAAAAAASSCFSFRLVGDAHPVLHLRHHRGCVRCCNMLPPCLASARCCCWQGRGLCARGVDH